LVKRPIAEANFNIEATRVELESAREALDRARERLSDTVSG
jgi:hypothetical protein